MESPEIGSVRKPNFFKSSHIISMVFGYFIFLTFYATKVLHLKHFTMYYLHYKIQCLIVILCVQVICLIYTPEARGPQAKGLKVYMSAEPQVHMV